MKNLLLRQENRQMKSLIDKSFRALLFVFLINFLPVSAHCDNAPHLPSTQDLNSTTELLTVQDTSLRSVDLTTTLEPLENALLFSTPEQDATLLVKHIDQAQTQIDVGIFGITSKHLADALIRAVSRKVQVRVICDKYCINQDFKMALIEKLKSNGVQVIMASSAFSISHWKMFVIDKKIAFVSTLNWISRLDQMRELGLFFTNPLMISEILNVFEADLENAKNNTALTPALIHPNLVWSPNNSEQQIVDLINSAETSIDIWTENMGYKKIHLALQKAVQKNIQVRLLLSECSFGPNSEAAYEHIRELKSYGLQVQVISTGATLKPYAIHAKAIVIDQKKFFIGSQNFSMNAIKKARELGIIAYDETIAHQLINLFNADWSQSRPATDTIPTACQSTLKVAQ